MTSFLRGLTLVWRGLTPVSRGWGPLRRLVAYCDARRRFSAGRAFKMAASPYTPPPVLQKLRLAGTEKSK